MDIYTIGFTRRSAESFFETLRQAGVERLVDVRRNNRSQLAGFSKRDDLAWFLDRLLGIEYDHRPDASPTQELINGWRGGELDWPEFATAFRDQLAQRQLEDDFTPSDFDRPTVLLCSEPSADQCHRRLIVEYLHQHWGDVTARHL